MLRAFFDYIRLIALRVFVSAIWLILFLTANLALKAQTASSLPVNKTKLVPPITRLSQLFDSSYFSSNNLCNLQLTGTVCWAGVGRDRLILRDDSGAALVEINFKDREIKPGQKVAMEGAGWFIRKNFGAVLAQAPVVNNDSTHGMEIEKSGTVFLKSGRHPIRLFWFNALQQFGLSLAYERPGLPKQAIPSSVLFRVETDPKTGERKWVNGLDYKAYEGRWFDVPDFDLLPAVSSGTVTNFDLSVKSRDERAGLRFDGWMEVPRDGQYVFYNKSDDGSRLYIDDAAPGLEVLENGFSPAPRRVSIGEVLSPEDRLQWIEAEGTVQFVSQSGFGAQLELESNQARMTVFVCGGEADRLIRYLHQRVVVRGICDPTVNAKGEWVAGFLRLPDEGQISLAPPTAAEWSSLKPYSVGALTTTHKGFPAKIITHYAMTSANDNPERDPKDWVLLGSNDGGKNWMPLDRRHDEVFENRLQRRVFALTNSAAFNAYRLQIDTVKLNGMPEKELVQLDSQELARRRKVQLAELELLGNSENESEFEENTERIISALGEFPPAETKERAFDNNSQTKWLHHNTTSSWIQIQYAWITAPFNRVVRIRGQFAEGTQKHSCFLVDGPARIEAHALQESSFRPGDEIDAVGFLEPDAKPPLLTGAYVQFSSANLSTTNSANASAILLTNVAQIRSLSREEQTRGIHAKIRGVVTCFIVDDSNSGWVGVCKTIQDASGGVAMQWGWSLNPKGMQPGDFVEVEGMIGPWANSAVIYPEGGKLLGRATMPKPAHPAWESIRVGEPESQWIELRGVVRSVETNRFILMVKGGHLTARVNHADPQLLQKWVGATVLARGVCRIIYGKTFQMESSMLEIPGTEFVQVENPASSDPFSLPIQKGTNLFSGDPVEGLPHRAKIAGVVTYATPRMVYVQDDSGPVKAELKVPTALYMGDKVQLVGFPEPGGHLPVLVETLVRKEGTRISLSPPKVSVEEILQGSYEGRLVTIEATCLEESLRGGNRVMELLSHQRTFQAFLNGRTSPLEIPSGSLVRLTAVCRTEPGPRREPGQTVSSFDLLLNSPSDVTILQRPPWWTLQHTIFVLGTMGLILGGAVVWIRMLRRKVDQRTKALKAKTAQLEMEIEQHKQTENKLAVEIEEHKRAELGLAENTRLLESEIDRRKRTQGELEEKTRSLEKEIEERIRMEKEVQKVNSELVETSRKAGMAEQQVQLEMGERVLAEAQYSAVLNERNRIARELHDTLAQGLAAISIQLQNARAKCPSESQELVHHLDLASGTARSCLADARRSIGELRPRALEQKDLPGALAEVARELTVGKSIQFHASVIGQHRRLSSFVETHILRIGQEALVNVVKHASPKNVTLQLHYEPQSVRLMVRDDGVGFDPAECKDEENQAYGLIGMRERAQQLNAKLLFHCVPGQGTEVSLVVPAV